MWSSKQCWGMFHPLRAEIKLQCSFFFCIITVHQLLITLLKRIFNESWPVLSPNPFFFISFCEELSTWKPVGKDIWSWTGPDTTPSASHSHLQNKKWKKFWQQWPAVVILFYTAKGDFSKVYQYKKHHKALKKNIVVVLLAIKKEMLHGICHK